MTDSIKHILARETGLKVNGSLWIEKDGKHFFGPWPLELLQLIAVTGSVSKAAKKMGMSYKKAGKIINKLNSRGEKTPSKIYFDTTGEGDLVKWYTDFKDRLSKLAIN